jgi:Helix-turn-helix domain
MSPGGFTKFPNCLWGRQISAGAKLTYLAIASFAYGSKPTAWPSQSTLSSMTGYSDRSIRRYTEELEGANLINVERRPRRVNRYELTLSTGLASEEDRMASYAGHDVLRVSETVSGEEDKLNKTRAEEKTKRISSTVTISGDGLRDKNEELVLSGKDSLTKVPLPLVHETIEVVERSADPNVSPLTQEEIERGRRAWAVGKQEREGTEHAEDHVPIEGADRSPALPSADSAASENDASRLEGLRLRPENRGLTDEEIRTRPDPQDREAFNAWFSKTWRRQQAERKNQIDSVPRR